MFHDSNLQVAFTSEHEFLLCLDPKETVIAGLFYRQVGPDRVHLEKLVVARNHRGKGVGDALLDELFRRLSAHGVRQVETGFFQPEYLARHGFRTDPGSGGLVADLEPEVYAS
jgi:ribosomal protein S18 acetylase RimI-like enzyme